MTSQPINLLPSTAMLQQARRRVAELQNRHPAVWRERSLNRAHGVHYTRSSFKNGTEAERAAAANQPTFLLIPGYGHSETAFYPLAERLAFCEGRTPKDLDPSGAVFRRNVAAISWRGHGLSNQMTEADLNLCGVNEFSDDVVAVAGNISGKVELVGHSFGAMVAMHAASKLGSDKVSAIDLLCPIPPRASRMRLSARILWYFTPHSDVMFSLRGAATSLSSAMFSSLFFNKTLSPEALDEKLSEIQPESRLAGRQIFGTGIFSLFAGRTEYPAELPTNIPIRIIAAADDRVVSMSTARALQQYLIARGMRSVDLVAVSGHHEVMWTNPEVVAAQLLNHGG